MGMKDETTVRKPLPKVYWKLINRDADRKANPPLCPPEMCAICGERIEEVINRVYFDAHLDCGKKRQQAIEERAIRLRNAQARKLADDLVLKWHTECVRDLVNPLDLMADLSQRIADMLIESWEE